MRCNKSIGDRVRELELKIYGDQLDCFICFEKFREWERLDFTHTWVCSNGNILDLHQTIEAKVNSKIVRNTCSNCALKTMSTKPTMEVTYGNS